MCVHVFVMVRYICGVYSIMCVPSLVLLASGSMRLTADVHISTWGQ
jgi:hypothetical protein